MAKLVNVVNAEIVRTSEKRGNLIAGFKVFGEYDETKPVVEKRTPGYPPKPIDASIIKTIWVFKVKIEDSNGTKTILNNVAIVKWSDAQAGTIKYMFGVYSPDENTVILAPANGKTIHRFNMWRVLPVTDAVQQLNDNIAAIEAYEIKKATKTVKRAVIDAPKPEELGFEIPA